MEKRLIVTADVHGSYSTWLTLKDMLNPEDSLAVAGDLFGTRYPHYSHSDYQPEVILEELKDFKNPLYFVYGNCDKVSFSPGYENFIKFSFMEWNIFLHHGDRYWNKLPSDIILSDVNLVIQGHTHVFSLEKRSYNIQHKSDQNQNKDNKDIEQQTIQKRLITLNPGSLSAPRTHFYTYAVIHANKIDIVDIKTASLLKSISIT